MNNTQLARILVSIGRRMGMITYGTRVFETLKTVAAGAAFYDHLEVHKSHWQSRTYSYCRSMKRSGLPNMA